MSDWSAKDWKQRKTWPPKGGAKIALETLRALHRNPPSSDVRDVEAELIRQRDEAHGREQALRLLLESVTHVLNRHGYPPGETLAGRIQRKACLDERYVDDIMERAIRAEARLAELERGLEDALTEEARREREACATAHVPIVLVSDAGEDYQRGWFDALEEKRAAIRARGRES